MSIKKLVDNYTAYNLWANTAIVQWLEKMDTQVLYQSTPSSFSSIDYTLQHILRTQKFWLRFVTGKSYNDFDWSVRENQVEQILNELTKSSEAIVQEISDLREENLLQELILESAWAKNKLSCYEYIIHAINHSTYHRGQIITMARTIGITENVPNTDYNMFNTFK